MRFLTPYEISGSVDGPSVVMEEVRGQHEYHNKKNNDKEENKR